MNVRLYEDIILGKNKSGELPHRSYFKKASLL